MLRTLIFLMLFAVIKTTLGKVFLLHLTYRRIFGTVAELESQKMSGGSLWKTCSVTVPRLGFVDKGQGYFLTIFIFVSKSSEMCLYRRFLDRSAETP